MIALLEQADRQSSQGTCNGADAKVRQAQSVLDTLPNSVDKDVRQALADGMERLRSLISSECKRPVETQTNTTPTETTPTQTTQTETTQTETTTTPTTTTPTTTTPTTTTPTTTTPTTTTPTTTTGTGGTPPPPSG